MKNTDLIRSICALFLSVVLFETCVASGTDGQLELAILNARTIDEHGELQSGMHIGVSSGKIAKIGNQGIYLNADKVVDANNRIVLPGFIDAHVHLIAHLNVSSNDEISEQINTDVVPKLEDYFRHGVTTIKSVGDPIDAILELRRQLQKNNNIGPRLLTAGRVIGAKDGHPGKTLFESTPWLREQINSEINTVEEAVQAVRELGERRVDAVKIIYSGNRQGEDSYRFMNMAPPRLPVEVMQAAVNEARRLKLRVTAHTVQLEEALAATTAGVNGLEHGVVIEPVSQEVLNILLKNKVAYVPTLRVTKHFLNEVPARVPQENMLKVARAGIPVVLGTDSSGFDLPYGNAVLEEAELMTKAGLTPLQVIRAMTRNAAYHLGLGDKIGTIAVNKFADLVIVDGEPLQQISDIRKIWMVIKDGQIMVDRSQDTISQTPTAHRI